MTDIRIKLPPIDFTPIDNQFIDTYLCSSRGDFVKIYLVCLRLGYAGESTTLEKISEILNLLESDVLNALNFWEEEGLMRLSPDSSIEILPLKKHNYNETFNYFDKTVKEMFDAIEKILGRPLSSKEVTIYINLIQDLKFTPEIVMFLVEYCCSKKKTDIRYIEKVAIAWYDSGIKTFEDVQKTITQNEEKWGKYRLILNFLGIRDGDVSKPQEEFLEKWLLTYSFPIEVILEACRICVVRINESNFSYIDAILSNWHKAGIKTLDDVNKLNNNTQKKNYKKDTNQKNVNSQSQYDNIKELERKLLGRSDNDE